MSWTDAPSGTIKPESINQYIREIEARLQSGTLSLVGQVFDSPYISFHLPWWKRLKYAAQVLFRARMDLPR